MMEQAFTTREVMKITGTKAQWLQYQILKGYITPASPGEGTGTSRHYSFQNLLEIELLLKLEGFSFKGLMASTMLGAIKVDWPGFWTSEDSAKCDFEDQHVLYVQKLGQSCMYNVFTCKEAIKGVTTWLNDDCPFSLLNLDQMKSDLIARVEKS